MTERERSLIRKLLAPEFPGKDEISRQIEGAEVKTIDEDGSLKFLVNSDITVGVKYRVCTECEYEDPDGITVHVLFHVVHGKAEELEFFREDNSPVQTWPDPNLVRVFAPV
jgi:hypothetical protein